MAADLAVANIMTSDVVSVEPSATVADVARLMTEHDISGIPVVKAGRIVGIVTERDMVAQEMEMDTPAYGTFLDAVFKFPWDKSEAELRLILATTAGELMSSEVVTVSPSTTVREAAGLMYKRRLNPLPVTDERGHLVGIVSRSDIIRLLTEM
ncbi:MAG TPA: CBS domain-containing protein [Thermomicrobiales bacterium]|nr:CBS domain-containing protein [Thermomicrobiales bacterium]